LLAEISEHIYNSNAIENSTLSLEETEKILLEIELDRYVSQFTIFYNNIVNLTIFLVVVHGFLINQYIVLANKF
jgi:hypothetical protein